MCFSKTVQVKMICCVAAAALALSACQKEEDYYHDSGLHNPYFEGSVLDYLDAQPFYFDTVSLIVRLSGMEDVFKNDSVTFFAPTDRSVERLIRNTNNYLYLLGYDTVRTLGDVPQGIWRKYLTLYLFHGANQLKDYPQIDYDLIPTYPGQGYLSWDGQPMNIGVIYNDDNGVKYVGYRQLTIDYIPDTGHPRDNWIVGYVASSNILTDNGTVHVLSDEHLFFGFDIDQFVSDMQAYISSQGIKETP
ncbi:hypothetical protein [Compostibacter hankyongensis]|uniref:Fasciclin domain-containing protein n=1 Tax=Compostibacter hankyongensis TaxID=1007089 RepID=A0ABP8G9D5_9BACT